MSNTESYYYQGTLYTWIHEPQNLYSNRHISIQDTVRVIEADDSIIEERGSRFKYIGLSSAGIITVITEGNHIVTAWHSSTSEVKTWLQGKG